VAKAQEDLHRRIKTLEDELQTALEEKERAFRYFWVKGKAKFEQEVLSQHKDLKYWLPSYILQYFAFAIPRRNNSASDLSGDSFHFVSSISSWLYIRVSAFRSMEFPK
jgi:hypothetical protein